MGEVAVHLEDVIKSSFEGPFEPGDVGSAEAQFAASPHEVDPAWVLLLLLCCQFGGAIGRAIIYYEKLKTLRQSAHGIYHAADVFALIVSRYDD